MSQRPKEAEITADRFLKEDMDVGL